MLLRLAAAPIRLPVFGALWLAAQVRDAAEAELNDPARLKARLGALEAALDAGEISEEEFEAEELEIIRRLRGER